MKAIILAAGKGTRHRPLTEETPKPMIKIANRPALEYTFESLEGLADEVIVVIGYLGEQIKEYFGNSYKGMKITYVEQKEQKGTGHALLLAKGMLSGRFVLIYGDDYYSKKDIENCLKNNMSILAQTVKNPENFGVLKADSDSNLQDIIEKPKEFISDLVNTGLYVLTDKIFKELEGLKESPRGEIEATDAVKNLAKKEKIICVKVEEKWLAMPFCWQFLDFNEYILSKIKKKLDETAVIESGAVLKGEVHIGKNSVIRSGAYIEGPVVIGDNCKIGPNCYIRPATSIGNNCHIGNAVEIKNSIIMDGTNVAHLSYVGDSIIGKNCNLGAGTKIANLRFDNKEIKAYANGNIINTGRRKLGAIFGNGVKTGINVSIMPGIKIGCNSIIGAHTLISEDVPSGKTVYCKTENIMK